MVRVTFTCETADADEFFGAVLDGDAGALASLIVKNVGNLSEFRAEKVLNATAFGDAPYFVPAGEL